MSNHVTILSMLQTERGNVGCHLFAYSSKSLPTLEIVGMGKRGKILKEKIIFWLKKKNIRLAPLKYVICLESFQHPVDEEEGFKWLELPSILLILILAEVLPLTFPENCFCAGQLGLDGNWIYPDKNLNLIQVESFLKSSADVLLIYQKDLTYFSEHSNFKTLDFVEMLESIS